MEHVNPADPHTDMPESQDTAKCDNSSESSDLNDSGYASQPGTGIISRIVTPDTSPKDKHESQTEGRRPLSSSSSLPFSFTLPFKRKKEKLVPMLDREVDELSKSRFQSIKPRFEKLLLENVLKAQKKPGTPYTPMATRIIMMGSMSAKSDNINPPSAYIVVLCRPEQKDVVQRFLRSSMVQDLCAAAAAGDDDTGPLKTAVLGYAPRLRLGIHASVVQVFADHTRVIAATTTIGGNFTSAKQSSTATLCGTPIRLQVSHGKGEGEGEGRMSIATLGGLIKVVTREGDIRVYGLTAGHALWELESGIETETEMETAAHKGQDNQQDSPIDLFSLVPSALADVPVEDEDHEDRNCQNQGSEDSRLVEQGEEEEEGVNKLLGVYDDADTDTFLQGEDDGDDDDDEEDEDYDDTIEIDLDDYLHQDDLTQKTAPTTTNTTTPWSFINSVKIGSVIYPRSSEIDARGASRSNRQGVFDWALIETSTYEANKLPIDAQAKLVLGQRTPGTTGSRPIYLISASGGVKKGWITPDAGSILCGSGSGGEFVDSYMVTMDTSDQGKYLPTYFLPSPPLLPSTSSSQTPNHFFLSTVKVSVMAIPDPGSSTKTPTKYTATSSLPTSSTRATSCPFRLSLPTFNSICKRGR